MKRTLASVVVLATACTLVASGAANAGTTGEASTGTARCSAAVALTGFSDHLDETTSGGQPVAGLSALAPQADGSLLALSDRSELFTLDDERNPTRVVALRDENGADLDSEGLVADRDGTLWITRSSARRSGTSPPTGRSWGRCRCPRNCRSRPPAGRRRTCRSRV